MGRSMEEIHLLLSLKKMGVIWVSGGPFQEEISMEKRGSISRHILEMLKEHCSSQPILNGEPILRYDRT